MKVSFIVISALGLVRREMLRLLVLVATGLWALYTRWKRRRIHRVCKEVPFCGLPGLPLIGQAHLFAGNDEDRMKLLQKLGKIAVKHGGMTSVWMLNKLYVVIADPAIAEVVLKSCLDKDDTTMKFVRNLVGNGNFVAPVSIWRPRRKILAPIFSIKNLNCFVPIFAQQSEIMVQQLAKEAGNGDFSFWKYITTYTFDAICKTSLGVDLNSQQQSNHPFLEAFETALHLLSERLLCPWLYLDCVYERLSRHKTFVAKKDFMYRFVDELIKKKREELSTRDTNGMNGMKSEMRTFLEMLLESSGGHQGYSDIELREEVLVIVLAGTDTSAVGAAYTAVMLSRYPEVQEKVYQELQEVFGDSDRPATAQDLPRLKYLEAVIKETLRTYPAVPVVVREVLNDVKLPNGKKLVNGVGVVVSFCAIHRHPAYWGADADVFRPERFLEGPLKHPAQFMPFSYSFRNCVGSTYAMMSMKTVLSALVRRYRLRPAALELRPTFNVMMKDGSGYALGIQRRRTFGDKLI
ncbi:cytochrome P450 4d8-like isoform X1 [Leguminivora glycinivorella]|uniref:cytochrome P450 4d8-like isoform X1 n=1 Tax=Leguminivora glycinivorella TaxID=1035111 RepID=UPI00200F8EA1|nr:cytochrome P450 4d8-like isoform X1 [Leguminivora glycinivorella]